MKDKSVEEGEKVENRETGTEINIESDLQASYSYECFFQFMKNTGIFSSCFPPSAFFSLSNVFFFQRKCIPGK